MCYNFRGSRVVILYNRCVIRPHAVPIGDFSMVTSADFLDEIAELRAKLSVAERLEFDQMDPVRRDRYLWESKEKEARLRIYELSDKGHIPYVPKEVELGAGVLLSECRIMDSDFRVRALRMEPHHETVKKGERKSRPAMAEPV